MVRLSTFNILFCFYIVYIINYIKSRVKHASIFLYVIRWKKSHFFSLICKFHTLFTYKYNYNLHGKYIDGPLVTFTKTTYTQKWIKHCLLCQQSLYLLCWLTWVFSWKNKMFVIQTVIHGSQQDQSAGMRLWCCTWAADSQLNLSMCAWVVIPGHSTSCALTLIPVLLFFASLLLKETVNKQGQHAWAFYRCCICMCGASPVQNNRINMWCIKQHSVFT